MALVRDGAPRRIMAGLAASFNVVAGRRQSVSPSRLRRPPEF
jgi:hypothetical protein